MPLLEDAQKLSALLPRRPRTAFERNLLPGFTRWLVEWVQDERPNFLIPAETKGARLLERAMSYARESLGTPIQVPVLYGMALAYIDPDRLRRARVLIVDDTVRTGHSLSRHRARVARYGAEDISAVTCIAHSELADGRPAAECFRLIDDIDVYREYVWQLTELVVARGLPPEVDHHVLTLRLPERTPTAWLKLQDALAEYGTVSVDDAREREDEFSSMTLHFPKLPGTLEHPTKGVAYIEGANKLRFFADPVTGEIHVVPVSFPALDVPDVDCASEGRDLARALIREWAQGEHSIGELLVEQAKTCDAEMVFRALSTVTEVDLLSALARSLGEVFGADGVSLLSQRDLFHRLYGERTGELVAKHVDLKVGEALQQGATLPRREVARVDRRPLALDVEVVDATIGIAGHLKACYEQASREPHHRPTHTIGESLSELARNLDLDRLLVSRCLDFGLAMTTLVPYVQIDRLPDDGWRVRREYRVSELNRDTAKPCEDLDDFYQWISEEMVAFIAHYLRTRTELYPKRPIPVELLAWLTAILRPLTLKRQGVALGVLPVGPKPTVVLRDGVKVVTLDDVASGEVVSEMFRMEGDGVVPTRHFVDLSDSDSLRIDLRGDSIEIEDYLALIVKVMQDGGLAGDALDEVLAAWAMCTDEKLGLSHVGGDLEAALRKLEQPLKLSLRNERHERSTVACADARSMSEEALQKLAWLQRDWASAVSGGWQNPTKRERALLGSLAAPTDRAAIYALPVALGQLVLGAGKVVEALDDVSARLWKGTMRGVKAHAVVVQVLSDCALMRRTLTSMQEDGETIAPPSDVSEAIALAAEELLDVLALIRAFVAATAGSYRGARGARVVHARDSQRIATVLFVDLSRSLEYALKHDFAENHEWKNSGLNLIAQWGRALGGREMKDREGDAIWLEFEQTGDAAVLCAAAVQEHARALRSTAVPWLWWGFHVAVDEGRLEDGDGGNVIGSCLDNAGRLAKRRGKPDAIERGLAMPTAAERCSALLRDDERMPSLGREIVLVEVDGRPAPGMTVTPRVIEPAPIVRYMAERLATVGTELAARSKPGASEPSLIPDDQAAAPGEPKTGAASA